MTGARRMKPRMSELGGSRSFAQASAEVQILGIGLIAPGPLPQQGPQEAQCLKIIGDLATWWQIESTRNRRLQLLRNGPVPLPSSQERPGLSQKNPVISDVVDHPQHLVAVATQSPAKLLQEQDGAFCRPQHQNGADVRHVDTFVEHVDSKEDVDLALAQCFQRGGSRCRRRDGVDQRI
jgi:hypothetical protein